MTTAQDVFEASMALMDELNEASGAADTADTKEYKNRTLPILNILIGEIYPYSDTYKSRNAGKRPIVTAISGFDSSIGLDDYICRSVLPYGLAAHLLIDENPTSASFFQQRYDELKAMLRLGFPAEFEPIEDIYGGLGCGDFARW